MSWNMFNYYQYSCLGFHHGHMQPKKKKKKKNGSNGTSLFFTWLPSAEVLKDISALKTKYISLIRGLVWKNRPGAGNLSYVLQVWRKWRKMKWKALIINLWWIFCPMWTCKGLLTGKANVQRVQGGLSMTSSLWTSPKMNSRLLNICFCKAWPLLLPFIYIHKKALMIRIF